MVVSKDSKRKRKESALVETQREAPKRTKVQAQRKFAQGQNAPSSSYMTVASTSGSLANSTQSTTSVKDNRDPPPELIPHKRPRTEDFLTYLCFRGTSVLPSHLDFLNQNKVSKDDTKTKTSESIDNAKEVEEESISVAKIEKINFEGDKKQDDPNDISYPVRKRAGFVADGNRRFKNNQQTTRLRGRDLKKGEARKSLRYKSSAKSESFLADNEDRSSNIQDEKYVDKKSLNKSKITPKKIPKTQKTDVEERLDNLTSEKSFQEQATIENSKEIEEQVKKVKGKKKTEKVISEPVGRMTRQRAFFEPVKLPYVSEQEKVGTQIEPKALIDSKPQKKSNVKSTLSKSESTLKDEKPIEFSSDDEQPLATTLNINKKDTRKNKRTPSKDLDKSEKKNSAIPSQEIQKKISSPYTKNSTKKARINSPIKLKESILTSSSKDKNDIQKPKFSKDSKDANVSQNSQTDISDSPRPAMRPSRKTKEAATIYMELIGQNLHLDDFEDDLSFESVKNIPAIKTAKVTKNKNKYNTIKKTSKPIKKCKIIKRNKKTILRKTIKKKNFEEENNVITVKVPKEKLEKSFSDSDDEPLAVKVINRPNKTTDEKEKAVVNKKNSKDSKNIETSIIKGGSKFESKTIKPENILTSENSAAKNHLSPKNKIIAQQNLDDVSSKQKPLSPISQIPENFPSPRINPTFLTPKFDRNLERKLLVDSNLPCSVNGNSMKPPKKIESVQNSTPEKLLKSKKGIESSTFPSANLMPSKEESGKIFGIASVSLAQSSGPDNTKCTLGKCGSIHKPVLGPVVPTEAYLGEPLSSKERRKAKVNMTHEQIQKWLIECSSNPDEIQDDLDDDFEENPKPTIFSPSPILEREEKESLSLSPLTKPQKGFSKSERAWSGKGPSLKATPIVIKSEVKQIINIEDDILIKEEVKDDITVKKSIKTEEVSSKEKVNIADTIKTANINLVATSPRKEKCTKNPSTEQKPFLSKTNKKPVYNTKICGEEMPKKKPNNFSAFSAENETSVYSFDKEDDVAPPVAKPFRRHSIRDQEESCQGDKVVKQDKIKTKDVSQNSISVTLTPEECSKSIKVCLEGSENVPNKNTTPEKATITDIGAINDSDSEGHTFYIPLQGIGNTSGSSGKITDLIQGVAVKLGREGPDGPNQRVIMHATLVTKAQMGLNTTPIPESMNVHEIVKNLLSTSKETNLSVASKSVPVGTVQPRFKSTNDGPNASGSGLTRVNSNSSLFSSSNKSRSATATHKKLIDDTPIKMCNNTAFPRHDDPSQMVEAPIFRPSEKDFQDPLEFIERIRPIAARFGICKIIPPESFKPECRVSDDMRFTAYNQYVHKMLHRWGPSAKELSAIKKYLTTQSIAMAHPPWIGGMEIDLPRLYHTVQELGGLKEVIEKKKWARVAEEMCIPKLAQDRVTKLDDIYCKYLLPYDTLSPAERQKLFDEVESDWAKREARARRNADRCINLESASNEDGDASSEEENESEDEIDGVSMECIVKGRNMPLNAFYRIARNTMALWFKNLQPTVSDIEAEFWRHVAVRDSHVCVHSGSIDSSGWGYGFPTPGPKTKGSTCAKHPWNLKILTNNPGSVLRSLGPVMGVTVPTLHVGMLFSACCWYRDPHGLSWIEYLHTGASKIWYGIPDEQSSQFRSALTALIPTHCQNKTIWLPCDTVMVPPHMLTDRGVSLCRIEQKPGEFVVVFPRAYTSSLSTGYVVSESVYFATSSWLETAKEDFRDIHESCEPAIFSLEQLLFAIASDQRAGTNILNQINPMITEVYEKEIAARQQLKAAGVVTTEKLPLLSGKPKQKFQISEEHECDICRANLYISMVKTNEENIYCLQHALKNINNGNLDVKQCKLVFTYNIEDIENLIKQNKERVTHNQKKNPNYVISAKKSLNTTK